MPSRRVHRWQPGDGERRTWEAPDFVTALAPRRQGGLIAALRDRVAFFDPATGGFTPVVAPEAAMPRRRSWAPRCGLAAAGSCLVLAAAGAALAADPAAVPDMVGTREVDTPVVVAGAGAHHPVNAPPAAEGGRTWKPRLRTFTGTMRVVGQEGERFWGTLESPYYREDPVGVFTGESGRFLMVDSDGFHEGEVTGPGRIRYCYRQNDLDLKVVGCGTMTKE